MSTEREHGQGDEGLRGAESKRNSGEYSDLGADRFDQSLGEAVVECGFDGPLVFNNAARQLREYRDAAAPSPGGPSVKGLFASFTFDRKDMPQASLSK